MLAKSYFAALLALSYAGANSVTTASPSDAAAVSAAVLSASEQESLVAPSPNALNASEIDLSATLNSSGISNLSHMDLHQAGNPDNSTDDCRFMSFEEWKRHKEKEEEAVQLTVSHTRETTSVVPNGLELHNLLSSAAQVRSEDIDQGKIYKDKFNYASLDCAATIVKTNSDAKGASAILTEVKDSYLLNKCSTSNKFVVIELCQDILVTSVVLGNFELFSSMFKTVKFSVSDRFPVTSGWHELGEFEAENIRDLQVFTIENPLIWARYLKVEILNHYGKEFYCPISLVRVHGTNMMEEFKRSETADQTSIAQPVASADAEKIPHYSAQFDPADEECRVVLPHLALTEFLKEQNSTKICAAPPPNATTSMLSSVAKTTEESLFRTIVNRLSLLESNASLSLLYVEEQSKLLSDAFTTMERRHSTRLENVLLRFNQSFAAHTQFLHETLQKLKQETQLNADTYMARTDETIKAFNLKTLQFTQELSFQRKVIIIDTVIILLLVAYVFISRELLLADFKDNESSPTNGPFKHKRLFPANHSKKLKHNKKKTQR